MMLLPPPQLCCVVCYNQFTGYPVSCSTWESAVTTDFYVALNIPPPSDGAVTSLPFCPECHSKVSVMFSLHQQILNVLQSFNCLRNEVAFRVVSSVAKSEEAGGGKKGPLDRIRRQIYERWKPLYDKGKEAGNVDVIDSKASNPFDYLEPRLSVADEFPVDPRGMSLPGSVRERSAQGKNTPAAMLIRKDKAGGGAKKGEQEMKMDTSGSDMPILEPMGTLPLVSARKTTIKRKKLLPVRRNQKQLVSVKASSVTTSRVADLYTHNPNFKQKRPKSLGNGKWKCGYCPMSYNSTMCVSQHESRCHPQTRPFLCSLCPKGCSSLDGMRKHLATEHKEEMYKFRVKCPFCAKSFGRKANFDLHIKAVHKGKRVPSFAGLMTKLKKFKKEGPNQEVPVPKGSPPSPEITDLTDVDKSDSSPGSKSGNSPRRRQPLHPNNANQKSPSSVSKQNESISGETSSPLTTKGSRRLLSKASNDKEEKVQPTTEDIPHEKTEIIVSSEKIKEDEANTEKSPEDVSPEPEPTTARAETPKAVNGNSSFKECPECKIILPSPFALGGHMRKHSKKIKRKSKGTPVPAEQSDIIPEVNDSAPSINESDETGVMEQS